MIESGRERNQPTSRDPKHIRQFHMSVPDSRIHNRNSDRPITGRQIPGLGCPHHRQMPLS